MIQAIDIKPGTTFEDSGNIYVALDILHNKTAMRKMVVKVKVRNLRTGAITDMSYSGDNRFNEARLDKKQMQYLYDDGDHLVFMDNTTYDQVSISKERLKWELNFMVENTDVEITYYEKEILGVALPAKVNLKIIETEPSIRGDTASKATKEATLQTGYVIRVPLFIEEGETVVVRTDTGTYDSRA
ncbi:elongation factor P [bacterium]|jgi:elongation factor P|nr:elongation factor P [bacterium]